ncbi:MAG TPA: DUF1223 domain-containing protein [Hyphomicrobium sp.]|jgi:hypothetical protein
MRWNTLALALAALGALAGGAHAAPRAIVELFTSPFCSSCPPADELFVELARKPDLITLVMPVDSWDRPGRKDALAKPVFTERQAAYADVRNEDTLYTPQAMINGRAEAEGSDRSQIDDGIAATDGILSVPVKAVTVGKDIVVSIGAAKPGVPPGGVITVLPFVASREIPMRGGETLHYANLVRDIVPLGRWSGKPVKQSIPLSDYAQYDGVVVLLQAGTPEKPGPIIGAARMPIRAKTATLPAAKIANE